MPSKTSATGGNSTELGTPTKVLVVCVLTSSWSDISDEEQMGIFARKFIEDVDARSKEKGIFYVEVSELCCCVSGSDGGTGRGHDRAVAGCEWEI
jgi:hypothetical protein